MMDVLRLWPQARTAIPSALVVFPLPFPVMTTTNPFGTLGINFVIFIALLSSYLRIPQLGYLFTRFLRWIIPCSFSFFSPWMDELDSFCLILGLEDSLGLLR